MKKPWIYIASSYTGNEYRNTVYQIVVADDLRALGYVPIWPLASHFWNKHIEHDYDYWMELDYDLIERCDALLRCGGDSPGADKEVEYAITIGVPVLRKRSEVSQFLINFSMGQEK